MTDTLSELLHRSADAVAEPRMDIGALVARAASRQRRRRVVVAVTSASLVAAVVVGAFAVRGGQPRELEPAPSPTPSPSPPSSVAVDTTGTRPLVYAEGRTVHVGDETFDAGGDVKLLHVTDDGVLFVIEDHRAPQLWLHDAAATEMIGVLDWTKQKRSYAPRRVETAPSGSLVVWREPLLGAADAPDEYVAYDTARHEEVARMAANRATRDLLLVSDDAFYFGRGAHVRRYDVGTGTTAVITRSAMVAELADQARYFTAVTQTGVVVEVKPRFDQVGRRLVAKTYEQYNALWDTDVLRPDGQRLELRLPDGYQVPAPDEWAIRLSYWLDDDRFVIGAGDSAGDLDPFTGDLLVCRLSSGACTVAQRDVIGVGQRY
jgi:hypothetical protein